MSALGSGSPLGEAVAFLTPFGRASAPRSGALDCFPLVGAGLGLGLGGSWWLLSRAWPAPVGAALVVGLDLACTGMLHFDGLVDSADGLLAHMDRARRLSVMSEPAVGAFGVAAGGAVLLSRFAALATTRPAPLLVASLWCASRTGMVLVARTQPYAREHGLASAFLGGASGNEPAPAAGMGSRSLAAVVGGGIASLAMAVAWRRMAGPVALASAVVAGAGVVVLAHRRLGGFSGDVLGAAGVVAETAGLLVAAARC